MEVVITFPSVYHALRAEKLLQAAAIGVRLTAIPRELSQCCEGLAAWVTTAEAAAAVRLLDEAGVEMLKRGVPLDA